MPVSSVTEHWIKPDAVTINLNHFGDPDYLQVSVLAGAVVMAFKQDVIVYNAAHNYRTWPLQAANTYLETTSAYNIYARLTRSEVNASALIVYDPILRDIEGRPISYSEDGSELLGDADSTYYYVFLGQISSSVGSSGQSISREWIVNFRFGQLNTSEQLNDVNQLLFKLFTPHFEDPLDPSKLTWIEAKSHIGVNGGVTMFVANDDIDLPVIFDGLPIDGQTLVWEETSDGKILKINPNIDLGGASSWSELEGKPSWITDTKPKYSYSEIEGTPDLSVYVTDTALSKTLADYATLTYLTGELKKYVTLDGAQDIKGVKNFVNGLKVSGMPITKLQDDVIYIDANLVVRGGVTMYSDNEVDIPSILDSLPIASNTALGIASFDSTYFSVDSNGMVSLTSVPSSGASSLGELLNVDASIDATASVDRVLYQPAGSATWTWRELPKDGVVGNYLPLSGGTLNGSLLVQANPSEWLFTAKTNTSVIYAAHADNYGIFASTKSVSSNHYLLRLHYNDHTLEGSGNIAMVVKCNGVVDIGNMSSNYALNVEGDIYGTNWLRTNKGWHNDSYGGGFYMEDTTYLRTYGGKIMYIQEDGLAGSNAYGIGGHTLQLLIGGGMSNHSSILLRSNTCGWGIASNTNGNMYIGKRPSTNPTDHSSDSYILELSSSGLICYGGITMYSDQRKKTILNHVELSLKQIANAPLIEYYYNSDQNKTTHVGSIAQYWAELNDWFCKLDNEGYYTMEIQNCALASAISIARHLEKYESKTDKKIRQLKKRISQLEDEIELLKKGA